MKFSEYAFPSLYDEPYSHQIETVKFILSNKRGFVLNTMGTGKTLSALWACDLLIINKKIDKALIIVSLSNIKAVWAQEIFRHLPHRRYSILHGSKAQRITALNAKADFYLINHDGIKVIEKELAAANFNMIIIDESTAYKNHTSERSKCMRRLSDTCKSLISMTGEPTPNSPLEAFSQARITNPRNLALPKSFYKFRDLVMYQENFDAYNWYPRDGWKKLVSKILSPAIRFELRDCVDLPPTVFEDREIGLSKEQSKLYKEMADLYVAQAKAGLITAANAGVKYLKLLQISSGCVFGENKQVINLDCNNKLNEAYEIFLQTEQKKLLIFALFRPTVKRIEEFFKSKGVKTDIIIGGLSLSKRTAAVDGFQYGDIEVLAVQPKTAAHGLTLTAANYILWFTPPPTNEIFNQANARIVRPSQTRTQFIVRFFSSPSEERVYKKLESSALMSNSLLEELKQGANI